jgi:hypothetical protein
MDRTQLILLCFLSVLAISACSKGNSNSAADQAKLLTGNWNLQQQKLVSYVDNVKQKDTVYLASANQAGVIRFNNDDTYNSACYFNELPNGGTGSLNTFAAQDSTFGTYKINASNLDLNNGIAGFDGFAFYTLTSGTQPPTITGIVRSSQITTLTSSKLNIHTELSYSISNATGSKTYKYQDDFYYDR